MCLRKAQNNKKTSPKKQNQARHSHPPIPLAWRRRKLMICIAAWSPMLRTFRTTSANRGSWKACGGYGFLLGQRGDLWCLWEVLAWVFLYVFVCKCISFEGFFGGQNEETNFWIRTPLSASVEDPTSKSRWFKRRKSARSDLAASAGGSFLHQKGGCLFLEIG